jgi:hypothetical protein
VIALAEALNIPFEIKQLQYNGLHLLGPRLLGRSLMSLTKRSREAILGDPPPDLTISAGHRSVAVVRSLQHRSGGRMRAIHVGFPRVSPEKFDLVIATPQYPIPDHPNLLRVPYALTRAVTEAANAKDRAVIDELPEPHHLLIVGGPTLFWSIDKQALFKVLDEMLAIAASERGSVLVTTSPRTPSSVADAIMSKLMLSGVPSLLTGPGQAPAYASLLDVADTIYVTADSVAMVSDAIWTGKPVALVPVRKSALGRAAIGIMDRIRPGQRLYPQDLRFFWRGLAEIGLGDGLSVPRASVDDELKKVLKRVGSVVDAARISSQLPDLARKNGGRGKD